MALLYHTVVTTVIDYVLVKPLQFLYTHILRPMGALVFRVFGEMWRISGELFWFLYNPLRALVLRTFWFLYDVIWNHILRPILTLLYDMVSRVVVGLWQTLVPPIQYLWGWFVSLVSVLVAATTETVTGFIDAINDARLYFSHARSIDTPPA